MKRFTQLMFLAVLTGIALVAIGGPLAPDAAPAAPTASLEAPMAAFGADLGPMVELEAASLSAWGGCIEPSACMTHADCGSNGFCLPNFDYPQVPSPMVCHCL